MTDHSGLKPYDVEVSTLAGRDEVWAAVTQPDVLSRWFGWQYDGLDAEIKTIFVDQAELLAPGRMGWADGSYLEVLADGDFARVHAAREGLGDDGLDRYDAIEEGWRAFLLQLRFLLERRPAGQRRTLYLTGASSWRQTLAFGSPHERDGWQRFGPRLAWSIDDDRLIVAAGRLPLDDPGTELMEVTVTTFGLEDATFTALREEWTKRWAAVAGDAEITTAADPSPGG